MDTDALIINEDEENMSSQKTTGKPNGLYAVSMMLRNNPELPDALRDIIPYFSPSVRPKIAQLAAMSELMVRVTDISAFSVNTTEESPPVAQLYGTMKKYIPMNKRQNIDSIMGFVDNIKVKMKPKPASNGIESLIDMLTRLNEMKKLAASAGAVKKIASTINNSSKSGTSDTESMISAISSLMGEDKMRQIGSMLEKLMG